jgi:hypothetical protein
MEGRKRSNVSASEQLGKKAKAQYRDHRCAQCGRVKKEAKSLGKHKGLTQWDAGEFCPYTCIECEDTMEQHVGKGLCKHSK